MAALDHQLAHLSHGASLSLVLVVALLLGLRHATDPDHLAAVSTLIASYPENGSRRAGRLSLTWALGHALTLVAFGMPIVLYKSYPPRPAQHAAEIRISFAR